LSAPLPATTQVGRAISKLQEIMDDLGHAVLPATHGRAPLW
jgi:hypothetical protein